jgi:hypothetical protein
MMKRKKPAFLCWKQYSATDSSGYELPAWEWCDALWFEGNQCSCKFLGVSWWIPCHLCKLNFETFASQNCSWMTLGTTFHWWGRPGGGIWRWEQRERQNQLVCIALQLFSEVLTGSTLQRHTTKKNSSEHLWWSETGVHQMWLLYL